MENRLSARLSPCSFGQCNMIYTREGLDDGKGVFGTCTDTRQVFFLLAGLVFTFYSATGEEKGYPFLVAQQLYLYARTARWEGEHKKKMKIMRNFFFLFSFFFLQLRAVDSDVVIFHDIKRCGKLTGKQGVEARVA